MNYQILPEMPLEQYEALKSDIAERGIMIPLEYDESGNLLDGHNRLRACVELGITDIPKITRHFETEQEKMYHIRAVNAIRRHLTQEQMRQIITAQLKDAPQRSDRQIAKDLGASPTTVGTVRKNLEDSGQLSKLDTSTGADGKEYPRQTERKPVEEPPPLPCRQAGMFTDDDLDGDLQEHEPVIGEDYETVEEFAERFPDKLLEMAKKIESVDDKKENDDSPADNPASAISKLQEKHEQNYYAHLDFGHDVYKEFMRIVQPGMNFEVSDERMDALRESFRLMSDFPGDPISDHIAYIDETVKNLNKTRLELLKRNGDTKCKIIMISE
jgi:hypothetical protein